MLQSDPLSLSNPPFLYIIVLLGRGKLSSTVVNPTFRTNKVTLLLSLDKHRGALRIAKGWQCVSGVTPPSDLMKSNIPHGFVKHSLGHGMLLLRSVRFFCSLIDATDC